MEDKKIINVTITVEKVRVSISNNREVSKKCTGCIAEFEDKLCSILPRCETNEGSFIFKEFH